MIIKLRKSKMGWVTFSVAAVTFMFYISDYFYTEGAIPGGQPVLTKPKNPVSDKTTRQKFKYFAAQKTGSNLTEINRSRPSKQKHPEQRFQSKNRISLFSPSPSYFKPRPANSSFNQESSENANSLLEENEDLIDLLDGEYEETIAYAFDTGLELDFFDTEEEMGADTGDTNDDAEQLSTEIAPNAITDPSSTTSPNANQAVLENINKMLSPDVSVEARSEYIKQLISLASEQSESEELIITTMNDLTEDADYSISDAAFEGLEALMTKQENESVPDIEMENSLSESEFD